VLSGNRNFEGRINPDVKMNYLASPPLCVAYALAGTMDIDLYDEPLGEDKNGEPVFLKDVWPDAREVAQTIEDAVQSDMFRKSYGEVFDGDERWNSLAVPTGERFEWAEDSTYVRRPPFFQDMPTEPEALTDVEGARVLAILGDSVTTDHISPAGSIKRESPAGEYLIEHGVKPKDFNSYGSRRGNHEVMMRGTFANIRLRNQLAPGTEGGVTRYLGDGDEQEMSIYDAAMKYIENDIPLVVLAGKEYGSGSSRDWAAKGTSLLGVRAVIAQSFERIHRSNLVGMGVLPLQFSNGDSVQSLGLDGHEEFTIVGIADSDDVPRQLTVKAGDKEFEVTVRIDTPKEQRYFQHGGILKYVLRELLQ
jgi:aconitate hydratase